MTFSEKLYKLRKEKGLSQEQLAEKLLISRQAISKWESGTAMPETEKLLAISNYFGVSMDYLLKENVEEQVVADVQRVSEEMGQSKDNNKSASVVGCIICIAGIIGLILWGLITIFHPTASSQISESSAIHIDGNGICLIICVLAIVLGARFLLRKSGNGEKNEKTK